MSYVEFGRYYVRSWGVNVVFMGPNGRPFYQWKEYEQTRMCPSDVDKLWSEHVAKPQQQGVILAAVSGRYQLEPPSCGADERPEPDAVLVSIDLDKAPEERSKREELMKQLAKDGYTVVATVRGFHVHAYLRRNDKVPYMLVLYGGDDYNEKFGEGAALGAHLWNMPPSKRSLGNNTWFTYSFVRPDGSRLSRFDESALKALRPPLVSYSELEGDMELYLGVKLSPFNPMEEAGTPPGPSLAGEPMEGGKHAVFGDVGEFLASFPSYGVPLPRCVAWVLYRYYRSAGYDDMANLVASQLERPEDLERLVPHGARKLVALTFALFMAHVVERIKFTDITQILSTAIEDWPQDKGLPLDRSVRYVLLANPDGYVYPRYGGTGAMNPKAVLGEDFCGEQLCPYSKVCGGRYPWKWFIKEVKKRQVEHAIQLGGDYLG